jgi:hypothetical protein
MKRLVVLSSSQATETFVKTVVANSKRTVITRNDKHQLRLTTPQVNIYNTTKRY